MSNLTSTVENNRSWKLLGYLAGNGGSTKTVTVNDITQYSELLLTCGTAISGATDRVLASTIIPKLLFSTGNDNGNGRHQAYYTSSYTVGISIISNTSIKIYANTTSSMARVYGR